MDNLLNSGLSAVAADAARKILESKVVGTHKQSEDDAVTTHQLRIDTGVLRWILKYLKLSKKKHKGKGFQLIA